MKKYIGKNLVTYVKKIKIDAGYKLWNQIIHRNSIGTRNCTILNNNKFYSTNTESKPAISIMSLSV